ncbi:MAG: long-chain fatty acid--CoA ligase [Deltaproteobacteria bacterium]|nr:long-chain fatty acid--CoA ligase [Deltaproteobacteria bacterium]
MSDLVKGSTLPEAFYNRYLESRDTEFYFSKRNGKWVGTTYAQNFEFVRKTIAGLKNLGFKHGQKIAILSDNREEWMMTDFAAQWLGGATAAIYVTSTPEQIKYILNESEAVVLFVANETAANRLSHLTELSHLKHIVVWDPIKTVKAPEGVKVLARENFLLGIVSEEEARSLLKSLNPQDLCILLYTSGTTGEPKGVMLTHFNFVSNLHQMLDAIPEAVPGKATISFLPLSHIYERSLHCLGVMTNFRIHFAESMDKLIDNLSEVHPQIMSAVPRIFEKIYAKIMERIKNASPIRKKIFFLALEVGKATFDRRQHQRPLPIHWKILYGLSDLLVFKKIRAITGGKAELFISGGAPLAQEIAEFFYTAGFTIIEGYGLSETCILCVNRSNRFKFGTVGIPFKDTEFKIAEDGEILVRGPQVMKGYYRRPDATAEVFNADGFFHTGDIGEFDSDGFLKITDRKKELIVTAGGKKIAPQPIENTLKKDPLIESVCIVGDKRKYVSALIVPNLELCKSWAQLKGLSFSCLEDCAKSAELRVHFQKEIDDLNAELPKFSTIKDFRIVPSVFSIDGGELTPTLKLKRRVIQQKYESLIASMYANE